jgi:hypothetical protein
MYELSVQANTSRPRPSSLVRPSHREGDMIDYELVRDGLEERRQRALHRAEVRRLLAGSREGRARRRWTAAVRSALGTGLARFGLWLAGVRDVRIPSRQH